MTIKEVTIADLTTGAVTGTGVFDVLMKSAKAHLEQEFLQSRIKGPEYSQVYLGALTQILQTSVQFLAAAQKIDLEAKLLQAQIDLAVAQKGLVSQQTTNAVQELENLKAQACLLKSQYDASQATVINTTAQTDLLKQKTVTEKAQTMELGVDDNSVLGKQKALYQAQTDGFTRDAEQKAAKLILDTWNARRMTDDATVADGTNMLDDVHVGRFVSALAKGINA